MKMVRQRFPVTQVGRRFGKIDLDRVGYFDDESPAPFDVYKPPVVNFREDATKGRQLLAGHSAGLFEKQFQRIFDGEALSEPWRAETMKWLERERAKIGPRMVPPSPSKKHSSPGDSFGCFNKPTYFSPELKPEPKRRKIGPELPNVKIKPNPLGGPGYADIGLSPYPYYSHELYDPVLYKSRDAGLKKVAFLSASAPMNFFPPNPYADDNSGPTYVSPKVFQPKLIGLSSFLVSFPKKPGGNNDGCFSKLPEHSSDPYDVKIDVKQKALPKWIGGGPTLRTKYTNSIIDQVTAISCNEINYRTYRARVYPLNDRHK